jgi:hypothetical protein
MAGYDIQAYVNSPEFKSLPPEVRDRRLKIMQARNAAGTGPVQSGKPLPVLSGPPVDISGTAKPDPNAPDFVSPSPPELEPGAGQTTKTAQAQDEAAQQAELERTHPTYQRGWRPNIPGLGPTTIIPGASAVSDVVGRSASALAQINAAPGPGELPGQASLRELTGPISGSAYKGGREVTPQTPEEASFDTAIALVTAGEMGMAERTAVRAFKAFGMSDEMAEAFGGKWIDDAMRMKRAGAPIRMATTGLGRGLGSAAGGGPFWGPFGKGTFFSGLGELGSGTLGIGSRYFGKDWLIGKTVSDLGDVLSSDKVVPELQGLNLKTPGDFERAFIGVDNSQAVRRVGHELEGLRGEIRGRISAQRFPISGQPIKTSFAFTMGPPGAQKSFTMSFDEAEAMIEHLNDVGEEPVTGLDRRGLGSKKARLEAWEMRDQLTKQLNALFPGERMGDRYMALRKRYGVTKEISRIITNNADKIFKNPDQIQNQLQKYFGEGRLAEELVDMLGSDAHQQVMQVIRGGSREPAQARASERAHVGGRIGMGGVHPHITPPRTYIGAGNLPLVMNPPAGPFSAAAGRKLGGLAPWLLGEHTPEFLSDQEQQ